MSVINLRSVPDDLVLTLKRAALEANMPFHQFCVTRLSEGLAEPGPKPAAEPSLKAESRTIKAIDDVRQQAKAGFQAIITTIPTIRPASTLPTPLAHAQNCPCYSCHPEKAPK